MHLCTQAANREPSSKHKWHRMIVKRKILLRAVVHVKHCRNMTRLLHATCFKQVPPKLVNHINPTDRPQRGTWQLETWTVVIKMENHKQGMSWRGPRGSGAVDGSERWTSLPTSLKIYSCCHWLSVALKSRNYRIFRAKQREERALLPCVCSQQAEVSHESWSWTFSEPPVCPQSTVILNYPAIYSSPQGAPWQRNPSQSVCTPLCTLNSSHVCVSEEHFLQHRWLISPVSHRAGLPLCKHKRHTGNTWTQHKTKAGTKSANNSIPIKDH